MDALLGIRVRDGRGREGRVAAAGLDELQIEWTHTGVLTPLRERVSVASPTTHELQALTLTEGWKPMSALIREAGSAPKSLLEDLQGLLDETVEEVESEPQTLEEAAKRKSGKSLEKKAREKRRARSKEKPKKGAGHNPFKTKKKLGPGPRHGTNSETKKWKCSCQTPYTCRCRSGKRTKIVRIGKAYKKDYNHEYKHWRKGQKF